MIIEMENRNKISIGISGGYQLVAKINQTPNYEGIILELIRNDGVLVDEITTFCGGQDGSKYIKVHDYEIINGNVFSRDLRKF